MRLIQSVKEKIMKNGLPEGYTRLEYLQSTGVQYIDTGFVPTSDNFQFEIRMFSQNTSAYLGYRSVNSGTATGDMRWFFNYNDGRVAIRYGDGTENSTLSFNTQTTHRFYFNGSSLYVDDVNYLTTTKKYATPVYKSFYLFSVNTSGYYSTDIANFVGRIYYAKIWDNDTLVRDFVPALDPSDKPCMYDLVSKQPFYNLGTRADFSIGKKLTPVEYIENTRSSYTNTGVEGNQVGKIIATVKSTDTSASSDSVPVGCGSGNERLQIYGGTYVSQYWSCRDDGTVIQSTTAKIVDKTTITLDTINKVCIFDNETKSYTASGSITSNNLLLFRRSISGTSIADAPFVGCIYKVQIWNKQNVLVRDLIPVRDENNVGYMLDLLTNTLYANAGSGSFAIGEDDLFVRNIGKTKFFKQTTRKVPRGFQEVEYLESTGTQYIDIGIKGKNNIDFDYKVNFTNVTTSSGYGIGGEWENSKSLYLGLIRSNGNFAYHYANTNAPVVVLNSVSANTDYSIQGHMWSGEQYMVINGTKSAVGTITGTFESTQNVTLFRVTSSSPIYCYAKIYYCKIYNNGILVRDFIPYLDNNGRPCMWDMVEGKPYYNIGTGEFSYGRKIIPVEYLESTGEQYIDTGITSNLNTSAEINLKVVAYSTNNTATFFGGLTSNIGISTNISKTNTDRYSRFGTKYTVIKNLDIEGIKSTIKIDKNAFVINGQSYSVEETSSFNGPNMYLFKAYGIASEYNTTTDIYNCKIYNNDTLVRDYIPCIDENNVPYMFDKVTHSAFLNAGTGDFLYGNPVVQRTETLRVLPIIRHLPLNYLESTGTQYINTGLLSTADSKVDSTFSFTTMESGAANNVGVFGGRNGQQSTTFTLFKIASGTPQYFRFDFNGQPYVATANQMTWNTTSKYRFEYNGTKYTTTNITTSQSTTGNLSPSSTFTTSPICLFAVNTAGTIGQYLSGRIYHYWYTDGTNTIDLYPVLKLPERIPCMYDRISKTYLYNAGTGDFLYGFN